ncbi:MAG TPA: carbohydrate-binding protein [Lachnospiraceae bacterium]|nr:carbohydrate-binding protein [Lachnospiraceae bacterium]
MKIEVYNDWDHVNKAEAEGGTQVVLAWDGEYRKGDIIEFSGLKKHCFYRVKVDAAIEESLILTEVENIIYTVPFYEKKTSFNPLAFFGNRHYVSIREARDYEIHGYKNLALNPFDQHDVEGVYPHASANVETRGEAVFAARNAIDGCIATRSHGEWPYESWGINRQADAEFRLDFGRGVDIDRIEIYTRADFPHDSHWIKGKLEFSDGYVMELTFDRHVDEPHVFTDIGRKDIRHIRLYDLIKADDPSPFPALTQIEVYGDEHA